MVMATIGTILEDDTFDDESNIAIFLNALASSSGGGSDVVPDRRHEAANSRNANG
jgi:hypothetical protein